ncbi:MAG: hypothetical protein U0L58_07825 [Ruminococcus sp.]|nr:hypothetical protein [Ruminococcus sp.]
MKVIKCELCGSNQLIKKDGFYQCYYCGTKYSIEEARKLIGTVEIIKGEAEKNRLLENVRYFISNNQLDNAKSTLDTLLYDYPQDKSIQEEYKNYKSAEKQNEVVSLRNKISGMFYTKHPEYSYYYYHDNPNLKELIEQVKSISDSSTVFNIDSFWKEIIDEHGEKLIVIEYNLNNEADKDANTIVHKGYSFLSDFDTQLICSNTNELPLCLQELQKLLTIDYAKQLRNGEILLLSSHLVSWNSSLSNISITNYGNIELNNLINEASENGHICDVSNYFNTKQVVPLFVIGKILISRDTDNEYGYTYNLDVLDKPFVRQDIELYSGLSIETILSVINSTPNEKLVEIKRWKPLSSWSNSIYHSNDSSIHINKVYISGNLLVIEYTEKCYNKNIHMLSYEVKKKNVFGIDFLDKLIIAHKVSVIRKSNKVCQYCGGLFTGRFHKVCSKCGKPKDYLI